MPEPIATMAGYHFGWWDADRLSVYGGGGKYVRAALAIAAAESCGNACGASAVAAAVELVHNFTLLHDDVIDRDVRRRGRPTVWSVWGVPSAILLGDALHAAAVRILTERLDTSVALTCVGRLEEACVHLCVGQFEDCAFEARSTVRVEDYLRMAGGKTAALMECACALGALAAGADSGIVSAFQRFGYELGLAFQCADDLIGIWGDPVVTGKPVGSDLILRKETLPVVVALNSPTGAAIDLARLYESKAVMTQSDIVRAAELVEEAGGREATRRHADQRLEAAIAALPDDLKSTELVALAQTVVDRNR